MYRFHCGDQRFVHIKNWLVKFTTNFRTYTGAHTYKREYSVNTTYVPILSLFVHSDVVCGKDLNENRSKFLGIGCLLIENIDFITKSLQLRSGEVIFGD